jgi:uncharacterized protein (DUF934 family)
MSVIVTDTGFGRDDWSEGYVALSDVEGLPSARAVELAGNEDPTPLSNLLAGIELIRVTFPAFNDGRGFTLGRRLRMMGYTGRLRAAGPILADQYAMARRVGFDEVEIPDDLAERQPQEQWLFRADWRAHDYQSRLRA